ncbi:MAG: 6-phosphogluconolactonase [Pleurocapsa sp.]
MQKFVEIQETKTALIQRSLELVLTKIQAALESRGQAAIALSGGSTPKPLYEALSTQSLPWEKIHVFWGDERYVSPTHPESNQLMTRQVWLDRVDLPPSNIHAIPTGSDNPDLDAQKYEEELRGFFQLSEGELPVFDLILLGMGDDGHTASLFPHTAALTECDRAVTVGNKDGQPRLTLTASAINQARCVMFIVAGENKRPALKAVFAAEADDLVYPARLIQPAGELWWLLDLGAAEELQQQALLTR